MKTIKTIKQELYDMIDDHNGDGMYEDERQIGKYIYYGNKAKELINLLPENKTSKVKVISILKKTKLWSFYDFKFDIETIFGYTDNELNEIRNIIFNLAIHGLLKFSQPDTYNYYVEEYKGNIDKLDELEIEFSDRIDIMDYFENKKFTTKELTEALEVLLRQEM